MLVLHRKRGQCIDLTGGIVVHVLEVAGGRVTLGFEAPESISVLRREVTEAIARHAVKSENACIPAENP